MAHRTGILTKQEHEARAMLLGMTFIQGSHSYAKRHGEETYSRLCADTLEPFTADERGLDERWARMNKGELRCKGEPSFYIDGSMI